MAVKFKLSVLPEKLAICHLGKNSPIPAWAQDLSFCSITRTKEELSIVCDQDKLPGGILAEKDWKAFKLEGELGMASVGVIASLSKPLAEAGISIFNISTYETNYLMVEDINFEKAVKILSEFCEIK
jgi:hypothetical protein